MNSRVELLQSLVGNHLKSSELLEDPGSIPARPKTCRLRHALLLQRGEPHISLVDSDVRWAPLFGTFAHDFVCLTPLLIVQVQQGHPQIVSCFRGKPHVEILLRLVRQ
jgi:hypothetical protein